MLKPEEIRAKRARAIRAARAAYRANRGRVWFVDKYGAKAAVHRDPRPDGLKWRITRFAETSTFAFGPIGHKCFPTFAAALSEVSRWYPEIEVAS